MGPQLAPARRVLGVWQEIVQALRPPARRATLAAVGGTTITRRRALVLGAAAGLGSLLVRPFSALGRGAPARARGFGMAVVPGDFEGATSRVLRAPRRFDLLGVRGPDAARGRFEVRVRRRGGTGARGWRSPSTATTRPTPAPASAAVRSGLGRGLRRTAAALLAAAARRAARALRLRPRRRSQVARRACGGQPQAAGRARDAAHDHPARGVGGRRRAAARGARLRRRADGLRPPHRHRQRLHARPVGLDGPRHRQVPPRHQRLERHRLQLPRRPVRAGLRRARGRGRPGGHRRPGAGLQLAVHRRRGARHLHRRADPRGRDGLDHAAARLEAHAARRARARAG